ncbi:hypothetical protein Tco_0571933, partial [Tanacetum coccineum]
MAALQYKDDHNRIAFLGRERGSEGKAPMPDLEIPAEFLAEDAQARQRLEDEQASARLVQ